MTYPNKHKQARMDFFDKMQEKMQAEDSKRRKLNTKSTSSQPELMFLQFNPKHGAPCFGNNTRHMSQQNVSKKTWKPPTKLYPSEPEAMDVGRKYNEKQFCTSSSSTFVNYINKTNDTHTSENQNENDVSPQGDAHNHSFMTSTKENTNNIDIEETESDSTKLRYQIKNVHVYDLDAGMKENDTLQSELSFRQSNRTMIDCDDLKQSNLVLEIPNKMQFQCFSNDNERLSDQDDIATQQNLNLSKVLDKSNSHSGTDCHYNDRKFYGDENKEISDNEDIRLINSIDLILSENQQGQHSESESNSENYDKSSSQKDKNEAIVESQCTLNEMPGQLFKAEGELNRCNTSAEMTTLHLETDSNNEIPTNLSTSSIRSAEVTQLRFETDNNNEISSNTLCEDKYNKTCKILIPGNVNDKTETSEINSSKRSTSYFHNNNDLLQSDGFQTFPDSSVSNENHEKVNNAPSGSSESYNHMNPSKIIQKAIKQVEISTYFFRSEELSLERRVGKETSRSVQDKRKNTDDVNKGVNNIVVAKNYEEHEPVWAKGGEKVETFQGKVKNEANITVKIHSDEVIFEGLKHEEKKTSDAEEAMQRSEAEEVMREGVNTIFDAMNFEVNEVVAQDKDKDKNDTKQTSQADAGFYDEEKNGFDDDCSCLMISNSQLIELEKKYYEAPENLKPPLLTITTQRKNNTNHETSSVGVQTESGTEILSSNLSSTGLAPALSAQWTKKMKETQKQLRDAIQEVGRLNVVLMNIRKELWPQRHMTEGTQF